MRGLGGMQKFSSRPKLDGANDAALWHERRPQRVAFVRNKALLVFLIVVILVLAPNAAAKAREKVLYRFTGGADGATPSSSLAMDVGGNLYGTTSAGGDMSQCSGAGCGTVFELTPSGNGNWQESVLYAFQGAPDGSEPGGNLLFDESGNIYGTTAYGGTGQACKDWNTVIGCGTVFELSPSQNGTWTESVLYSFQAEPDGALPAGLTFDTSGVLYGITVAGGDYQGTIYSLSPPKQHGDAWTERILYTFGGFFTANPGLVFDGQGNLYGTDYYYAGRQGCGYADCGAVYTLERGEKQWTETDLYDFLGGGYGGQPAAGVIRDSKGNLYGVCSEGGNDWGIVFEVWPSGRQWKEHMLYNFCSRNNCADGAFPLAGLVMDSNGVLYGTTYTGGESDGGVVFKLAYASGGWVESVLHAFTGGASDGAWPQESLILDSQGDLYGVANTSYGYGSGVVFEVTP